MSNQPRALELARSLDSLGSALGVRNNEAEQAASLLRSQHEVIGELVGALDNYSTTLAGNGPDWLRLLDAAKSRVDQAVEAARKVHQ